MAVSDNSRGAIALATDGAHATLKAVAFIGPLRDWIRLPQNRKITCADSDVVQYRRCLWRCFVDGIHAINNAGEDLQRQFARSPDQLLVELGHRDDTTQGSGVNGLNKAELVHRQGQWRNMQDLEMATLGWVDWFNIRCLLGPIGNIPAAEAEENFYAQRDLLNMVA